MTGPDNGHDTLTAPEPDASRNLKVSAEGGFIVLRFDGRRAVLTKKQARQLGAVLNKAAL